MFTIEFDHLDWLLQFYSKWKQTSKLVNLKISAKVRVSDLGQNLKMVKTFSFSSIHQENSCKSCSQLNFIIWTDFHSFSINEDKLKHSSPWRFLLKCRYAILVKIWKWLKLLNSLPFIKKTFCKSCLHSNLIICTDFHSYTVNEHKRQN